MIDFSFLTSIFPYLIQGLVFTLELSIFGFILGFFLGITLAVLRLSNDRLLSSISSLYIDLIRGTPLLVQILIIYFGLPSLGIYFDPITAGILAIGLNSGAYQAEIIRSGIRAIPKENIESAQSLGLTDFKTYRFVVLPLAIRNVVPALTNELVTLVKDSSLISVIGVPELTRRGEYIIAWTFRPFEVYLLVALIYFVVCYFLSKLSAKLERRLAIPGFFSSKE
ncbi:MAG: amino acid ABC transporter permease [Candidatus Brockarchaeota archaeon]|nr:amino acid ABC transporter permease [Candidatus Brockarchaeota archaeon]MBO3762884.1 amino acid ABC transporter permease [Candidatus Brockarchaeota archaeon]MBO3768603.1 amino acid ABC transporter permease [Candidatus Brockarchaeota archaeon]MBO3800905.1 amino acid ABC transporter permease [Candidatus Brockarchaeota archaeon]